MDVLPSDGAISQANIRMNERIKWIDVAKGLGLILVVVGHFWYGSNLPIINQAIYSFHVPMFFMLSGLTSAYSTKQVTFAELAKKKAVRLLVPSAIFIAITIPVYIYANKGVTLLTALKELSFFEGSIPYNSPCWFLIVLFEVEIMAYFIKKLDKKIGTLVFVLGYIIYKLGFSLVFGLDKAVIALGFYMFGYYFKDALTKEPTRNEWLMTLVYAAVWVISGLVLNSKVTMYEMKLGYYWLFILSGTTGSLVFIFLCKTLLRNLNVLAKVGNNTVFIMGTHVAFSFAFKKGMAILGYTGTWVYTIAAIIIAVGIVFCYLPVCKLVDRYLPILSGKVK